MNKNKNNTDNKNKELINASKNYLFLEINEDTI